MNIHHLELFYYVAKFGGISEGVRHMPYGIQQPAMSAQIIQLEEFLGTVLFRRRPFALTPAGQELFQFIKPFFENLTSMAEKLRGGVSQQIRVGASEIILRDYLPVALQSMRRNYPKLKLVLREGYHAQLHTWLQNQELDVIITLLENKPAPGSRCCVLLQLPLVLLVHNWTKCATVDEFWTKDRIEETLISIPTNEPIYRNFVRGLNERGIDWFPGIEVSTLKLVETYAAHGYGVGLSVAAPKAQFEKPLRALPLVDFEPVTLGALWQGRMNPLLQAFLDAITDSAKLLSH